MESSRYWIQKCNVSRLANSETNSVGVVKLLYYYVHEPSVWEPGDECPEMGGNEKAVYDITSYKTRDRIWFRSTEL